MNSVRRMNRRSWVALALLPALAARAAQPAAIRSLGVFALLGESLQIVFPADATDTRLDRNLRETLPAKDIGFDQAALRAVSAVMGREMPAAQLKMYRSTEPMTPDQQRALAEGAARAELPAWIVNAIQSANLSHLLLITRHRGAASFPVPEGYTIGRGNVEGIGYYLDNSTELKNPDTGKGAVGFLGAFVMLRVQLMDAQSGQILGSQDVRAGEIHAGRNDTEAANVWNALDPREKVEVLRRMVEQNVTRVLPAVLGGS